MNVAPLVIFKLCWYGRDISALEHLTQSTAEQLTLLSFTPATSHSHSDASDACHEAYHCLRTWYDMKYLA